MTSAGRRNDKKMRLRLTDMPNAREPQFALTIGVRFGETIIANFKNVSTDRAAKLSAAKSQEQEKNSHEE